MAGQQEVGDRGDLEADEEDMENRGDGWPKKKTGHAAAHGGGGVAVPVCKQESPWCGPVCQAQPRNRMFCHLKGLRV